MDDIERSAGQLLRMLQVNAKHGFFGIAQRQNLDIRLAGFCDRRLTAAIR
jgi:hypothetical protein